MSENRTYGYQPETVSPPGDTLLELLETIGMSQAELAERAGRPTKTINEIIKGKAAVTPETALQLERVLGVPASFWNNRERNYREALARKAEQHRLRGYLEWLDQLPIKAMSKVGWIRFCSDPVEQLREALNFFGVASPGQCKELWAQNAAFRKSRIFAVNPWAIAAWLRKGGIEAQNVNCEPFNPSEFNSSLQQIRHLSRYTPEHFQPQMQSICSKVGVAVVFVPELKNSRLGRNPMVDSY